MSEGAAKILTPALLRGWPLPGPAAAGAADPSGKIARGRALVVGGGCRTPGAVLLAGTAALRAGASQLRLAVATESMLALAMAMPEARVLGLRCDSRGEIAQSSAELDACAKTADALLVGCGMEVAPATRHLAGHLLHASRGVVVLDAGGLDAALVGRLGRARGPRGVVMTPTHAELAAMLDLEPDEVSARAQELAREFAQHSGVVLVLKGSSTFVATPDGQVWVQRERSPGLDACGSGDVLAGLIAGLAARGATPAQAAAWGVHLHARAGAALEKQQGPVGYLARELAAQLPPLLAKVAD